MIINILSLLILDIDIGIINHYKQIYLTSLTGIYILKLRNNNQILLNTFITMDILFIIIKLQCFI